MTDTTNQPPSKELAKEVRKILFLDVDGVLNSDRTACAFGGLPRDLECIGQFDWVAIALLQRLCKAEPRLKIVMSSSWRLTYPADRFAKAWDLPVIDVTPGNDHDHSRGEEIQMWLDDNPDVRIWAAIDDHNWMLPRQQKRFVKTDEEFGLTMGCVKKLIRILEISETAWRDLSLEKHYPDYKHKLPGTLTQIRAKEYVSPASSAPPAQAPFIEPDKPEGLWLPRPKEQQ